MKKKISKQNKTFSSLFYKKEKFPISRKTRMFGRHLVMIPVWAAICFCASSCNRNKMYEDYKSYGEGYESALNGGSKPPLWSAKAEKEGYEAGLHELRISQNGKSQIVEFQYTKEEIKALESRWSTFEEMLNDALRGDQDAMFSIGLCYLYGGKGLAVDTSKANTFFGLAASLGHAPSLEKIRGMYHEQLQEDMSKGLLHQVYLNLIIAFGHTEYTPSYHKIRTALIETFGEKGRLMLAEIERISQVKLDQIHNNLKELELAKKSKTTDHFFLQISDITSLDDQLYNSSHWLSVAEGSIK